MGQNINQVKKAFLIAALLLLLVMLAMIWIPFLILNINPNLEAGHITTLYNRKLHTTWFKMVDNNRNFMSSADSFINNCAVLFGYDLKEVFNIKVDYLILSKIFELFLGIFAIYLAISTNDLLSMLMISASFYMSVSCSAEIISIIRFSH